MCSHFFERMGNYQGDLDDIIRAGGGGGGSMGSNTSTAVPAHPADWQFPSIPVNYSSGIEEISDYFGHPFSNMRDPYLHDIDTTVSGFFNNSNNSIDTGNRASGGGGGGDIILGNKILDRDEMKTRPSNIFSRILQISPNEKLLVFPRNSQVEAAASHGGLKAAAAAGSVSNDQLISPNSSKSCLMENPGVQISPPRNTGIKRRKSQAKKVVCIPAPAPANSRPGGGGEVVPSDLWAWRKYGQKPIKGSPYPRGYYRCSSSKGCSARKQVERSRTDPTMLVITYTSEHNHPWPTQRNALAGSARSQPSKINSPASKTPPNSQSQRARNGLKDKDIQNNTENAIPSHMDVKKEDLENQFEMDDAELNEGFSSQSYKPALLGSNQSEDLFADLGEIEADPLDLLFMDGFSGDEGRDNKALDPFSFYDWSRNNNNNNSNTPSYEEPKRDS